MVRIIILFLLILLAITIAFPFYSMVKIRLSPSQKFTVPQADWGNNEHNLYVHVEYLSEVVGSRSIREPHKIAQARDYIFKTLNSYGLSPVLQDYTVSGNVFSNIEAVLPGSEKPQEIIVVGAHYDTVSGSPGADDNASAVAVLLEAARLIRNDSMDRTLKLVFFTLEEPPIFGTEDMGSRVFARQAKKSGMDIKAMICLEMVGYFSEKKGGQAFPLPLMSLVYPSTPNFIAVIGNLKSRQLVDQVGQGLKQGCQVPVETLAAPSIIPGISLSDHSSFWKEGYPAVMITDTAFYRNPNYHQTSDTKETLNYEVMAELLKGLVHVIRILASNHHGQ